MRIVGLHPSNYSFSWRGYLVDNWVISVEGDLWIKIDGKADILYFRCMEMWMRVSLLFWWAIHSH